MAYADLQDVKSSLGIAADSGDADEILDRLLTAAEAAIDRYTGRSFGVDTDSTRYFDACAIEGQVLYLDEELASLTSVTNGDGESLTVGDIKTRPRNIGPYFALVLPWSLTWRLDDIDAEISVTGKWGYSTAAPEDIRQATIRLAGYWYRLRDAQVFDTVTTAEGGALVVPKGMPADVQVVLQLYRKTTL
jgi:hypothetical protein